MHVQLDYGGYITYVSNVARVLLKREGIVEFRVMVRDGKGTSLQPGSLMMLCTHCLSSKSRRHSLGISEASHAPPYRTIVRPSCSNEV